MEAAKSLLIINRYIYLTFNENPGRKQVNNNSWRCYSIAAHSLYMSHKWYVYAKRAKGMRCRREGCCGGNKRLEWIRHWAYRGRESWDPVPAVPRSPVLAQLLYILRLAFSACNGQYGMLFFFLHPLALIVKFPLSNRGNAAETE